MARLPFRTARLLLRPVADRDLPRLLAILGDAEVMKLALYERPLTADEAKRFIAEDFSKEPDDVTHLGVLCRIEDDAVIGFAGLLPCKYFRGDLEIGFVLAAEHQGKGYATEIARKLIDVGFEALGCARLLALCDPRNSGSSNVLEKLGMTEIDEIPTPDRGRRKVFEITRAQRLPCELP
jgi:RimJ/RimL family protein N-acetyltransferase